MNLNLHMFGIGNYKGNKSTITEIVMPLEDENYHLFMDRYYISPKLIYFLRKNGFSATGTVLKNRFNH